MIAWTIIRNDTSLKDCHYLPKGCLTAQQYAVEVVSGNAPNGIALLLIQVHATVQELIEPVDAVADGLDLIRDQLLFLFLFHRLIREGWQCPSAPYRA